jgi:prepilin-type N-terminal cleavage/methylation domain-containing protein
MRKTYRFLAKRVRSESGFTLVELLISMVLIGVLAAIALALFTGQKGKADDANAKSNASGLSKLVEACRTDTEDFQDCDTVAELGTTGIPVDTTVSLTSNCDPTAGTPPAEGEAAIFAATVDCFIVKAQSSSGHIFVAGRTSGGKTIRVCMPPGQGGCRVGDTPGLGDW